MSPAERHEVVMGIVLGVICCIPLILAALIGAL